MIINYRSTIGTKILNFDSGELLGIITDIIVDTDTGKIEACWIKPISSPFSDAVIQSCDIVEWKKNIYIRDESAICDPAEVVKLSEILTKNTLIIGNNTENKSGERYGKVVDYDFDTKTFFIKKILSIKSFFWIFIKKESIFSYNSIIEVLQDKIIIKDLAEKKETVLNGKLVDTPDAV